MLFSGEKPLTKHHDWKDLKRLVQQCLEFAVWQMFGRKKPSYKRMQVTQSPHSLLNVKSQNPPAETPGPRLSCPANQRCKVSWNSSTWQITHIHAADSRPLLVIVDMWSPISRTMSQESVKTLLYIIVWFQSVLRKQQALSLRKLTCTLPALRWNWRRWLSVRKALGGTGSENGHSKSSGLFHSQHEWTFSIITML